MYSSVRTKRAATCVRALAVLVLHVCVAPAQAKVGGDCNITKVLKTQSDLDSIRADCKKIVGSLDIQCADDDQINNFEVFRMVEEITGYLRIEKCKQIENLELGFQNLKAIHGEQLLAIPGLGDGFAMYIVENQALTTLGGLQNMTTIEGGYRTKGKGRVYIVQNEMLCFSNKMDWLTIIGPSWRRAVYEITGQRTQCGKKLCHASCSCELCTGPSKTHCQGVCTGNGSDYDAVVMTTMALMCMLTTILAIFISLYLTDRCGLRLKYFTQLLHFGIEETERHRRTSAVDGFATDLSQMRSLNTFGKDGNTNATITADPFETQLNEDQKADFQIRAKGSDLLDQK